MRTEYAYQLSCKLSAQVILEGAGQQPLLEGDLVEVVVKVSLPISASSGSLLEEIQFGRRIAVFNEYLSPGWGTYRTDSDDRTRVEVFRATTWAEARKKANEYAKSELAKLRDALTARAAALEAAGEWE